MNMTGRVEGFWPRLYHPPADACGHERQLCADLRAAGVDASTDEREWPGVIRISGSPIRWVRVLRGSLDAPGDLVVYGVPDFRQLPAVRIFPRWDSEGRTLQWICGGDGAEVADRLNEFDVIDCAAVADNLEAIETSEPENSWLIVQRLLTWNSPLLQWYQWCACEKIARTLLATPIASVPP
jgi:hypothetical protein